MDSHKQQADHRGPADRAAVPVQPQTAISAA
jgi:hypothetical protein